MVKRKSTSDKYFTPERKSPTVPMDTRRKFVIQNKQTGYTVRTRGYTLREALDTLSLKTDNAIVVDLGPSGPDQFIAKFVAPDAGQPSPVVTAPEAGKE